MKTESNLKERCQRILEENGGKVADIASTILLEDPKLKNLRPPLEFISNNWRDPLTPSLITLSCRAVGRRSDSTYEIALAMSLITLSSNIWDDIVDTTTIKASNPTLLGKFGEGTALMIGGLALAKAFLLLGKKRADTTKHEIIVKLLWEFFTKIAEAETANLNLRDQRNFSSTKKLRVIKMQAINLETCLKLGATLGNGSNYEATHLGEYGRFLSIILELWKDFTVSINLTQELGKKIRTGALPYSLLWARQRSEDLSKKIDSLANKNTVTPSDIKEIVENTLKTRVLHNTISRLEYYSKKAKQELSYLKENRATRTLDFFVEAQPQLFIESLSQLLKVDIK